MKKLIAVVGPTATGKTEVAMALAQKYQGQLVSCDSRQVYQGLNIGSGKLPAQFISLERGEGYWIIDGVKIWGYDLVSPLAQFSVKDYVDYATDKINQISDQGKLAIIVGGTGFYLKGLLEGLANLGVGVNQELRAQLETEELATVQQKLITLSPAVWQKLNHSEQNNKRRLIRQIELLSQPKNIDPSPAGLANQYQLLKIGLTAPKLELDGRIDRRVDLRIEQGMIDEAKTLYAQGVSLERFRQLGLEYGLLGELLAGEIDENGFRERLKVKNHQYAKRQLTWFKRDREISWFDITTKDWLVKLEKAVSDWYNSGVEKAYANGKSPN